MSPYRLPGLFLARAATLLVAVGLVTAARRADVGTVAAYPTANASVEAAWGTVQGKPMETQLVTVGASLSSPTAPDRARLRSGTRAAIRIALLHERGVTTLAAAAPARAPRLGALPALRHAAFSGRWSAPSTAPPTGPL